MPKDIPTGVKIARITNVIVIAVNIVVAILVSAAPFLYSIDAAQDAGKTANPILLIVIGLVMFAIFCIPSILLIKLNKALWQLKKNARVWQIVGSALMLLAFPLGTIFGTLVLYFMIFDKGTKDAFLTSE